MQPLSEVDKYLWNYELITYTDNTTSTLNPVIIGVYGNRGYTGANGDNAVTFQVYSENAQGVKSNTIKCNLSVKQEIPTISAKIGSTVLVYDGTYQVEKGAKINVTATNATKIYYKFGNDAAQVINGSSGTITCTDNVSKSGTTSQTCTDTKTNSS